MLLIDMLNKLRTDNPNVVAREDDEGVYFDLAGNNYPNDPIIDVSHTLYIN